MGLEGLKYIYNYFVDEVYSIAYQENIPIQERIELYIKKIDDYFLPFLFEIRSTKEDLNSPIETTYRLYKKAKEEGSANDNIVGVAQLF